MESDKQVAAKIVADPMYFHDDEADNGHAMLRAAIVRALQAARTPPPGHIIDDAGVVRKVLGTLPITKDGCVVGYSASVSWNEPEGHTIDGTVKMYVRDNSSCPSESWVPIRLCFGSRESAEAAKEATK